MTGMFDEDFSWPLWPTSETATDGGDVGFADTSAIATELVITDVIHPRCLAFVPQRSNGRAVLIMAGGGYTQLMAGKEGVEVAHWLTSLGFHAFVLVHRFPSSRFTDKDRGGEQAPVDDAIEAMRQIRSRAAEFDIDPSAVGALGLSSGGHLAACLITRYPSQWQAPTSPHTAINARPDFLIVGYGPISTNASGRTVIPNKPPLPPPEKQALYEAMQPDVHMIDSPPPAFIVYSADDQVVPVDNGYRLHQALRAKGAAAELHIFSNAPHGFALRETRLPVGAWTQLCSAWLRQQTFLEHAT
jgi:acetyl esterase/lipase